MSKYYSINEFSKILGVSAQTLRNWDKNGKLHPHHTSSNGYRYYSHEQLNQVMNMKPNLDRVTIGYCGVSSNKQKDDLERQIENMKYYITIPGKLDNLNDYINACRSNRAYGNRIKEANQDFCKAAIFECIGKTKIKPPVYIEYYWYEKDRRRDLDNISSFGRKVFQDALVEVGTLPGDGWRQIVGFSDEFYIDQENPRVEVVIREVESGRAYHDPEKNSRMGMV